MAQTASEAATTLEETSSSLASYVESYGARLILSIIFFFVFSKLISVVLAYLDNFMKKRKIDPKISDMVVKIAKYIMYLFLVLVLATFVGIEIAYIVILIIVVIAVIAFAMQNTLVNVGAGFVIAGLKLFKKGDYLEIGEIEGDVRKIDIYHTELIRSDNSIIFIPNSDLLNGKVVNTDKNRNKRVDVEVFVGFDNEIDKLRKLLLDVTKGDKRILENTEPRIIVHDIDKVSIKMRLSIWVKKGDYWDVLYDYNEKVIDTFKKNSVTFPDKNLVSWFQEGK